MAGKIEVFVDKAKRYRFRLLSPNGSLIAVSPPFTTKRDAAAGIHLARECAGTALVTYMDTTAGPDHETQAASTNPTENGHDPDAAPLRGHRAAANSVQVPGHARRPHSGSSTPAWGIAPGKIP